LAEKSAVAADSDRYPLATPLWQLAGMLRKGSTWSAYGPELPALAGCLIAQYPTGYGAVPLSDNRARASAPPLRADGPDQGPTMLLRRLRIGRAMACRRKAGTTKRSRNSLTEPHAEACCAAELRAQCTRPHPETPAVF